MNKRHTTHIVLLMLPPLTIYIVTYLIFHDLYLAVIASYLVLLVILQFVAIEDFLLFRDLQELWRVQSESERQFSFEGAIFQPPFVTVSPKVVLSDANFSNVAKLKYLVGETGMLIPGMRDECKKLIFLNLFLLLALMIITPPTRVQSPQAVGTHERSALAVGAPVTNSGPEANAMSEQRVKETPPPGGAVDDLVRTQGRLGISYFAVVLQLLWVGRIAFYFRQKNADLFFQATAT